MRIYRNEGKKTRKEKKGKKCGKKCVWENRNKHNI
jgi:hypothetical protein